MTYRDILLMTMFVMLASIIGMFTYWNLEGVVFHRVYDRGEIAYEVTRDEYRQGEAVEGRLTACKLRAADAYVQWSLVDTYLRSYPPRTVSGNKPGCYEGVVVEIERLSETLPPDTYYFSGSATYQLNPIKRVVIPLRSDSFKVLEK